MDTVFAATPAQIANALTRVALRLLDVSFEPASVGSGERFDHVVESLSDQLSDAASALFAGRDQQAFRAPVLPQLTSATTRRAQTILRQAVDAGRLPGSTRSLRTCRADLLDIRAELDDLATARPDLADDVITPCADAVSRLARIVGVYEQGHARIAVTLASPGCSREAAADSATRGERALLRCLDRCGDERALR